jgi:NADPH-dependent ferric siderophore reductase
MSVKNMQNEYEGRVLLQVRISPSLKKLIAHVAKVRGISQNDVVREFILKALAELSYLTEEERKALGVYPQCQSIHPERKYTLTRQTREKEGS